MVNDSLQMTTPVQSQSAREGSTVSEAVVEAVADAENISASDVRPPLYEVIDPDALDDLFAARFSTVDRTNGRIVFPYCGYEVTVYGNGEVTVGDQFDSE